MQRHASLSAPSGALAPLDRVSATVRHNHFPIAGNVRCQPSKSPASPTTRSPLCAAQLAMPRIGHVPEGTRAQQNNTMEWPNREWSHAPLSPWANAE